MIALSSRPFCSCDGRRVNLWYLSAGPRYTTKREDKFKDLDLEHLTRNTIHQLQEQLGRPVQFFATLHDDHAPHRHVHGILILQGKLTREDFKRFCRKFRF